MAHLDRESISCAHVCVCVYFIEGSNLRPKADVVVLHLDNVRRSYNGGFGVRVRVRVRVVAVDAERCVDALRIMTNIFRSILPAECTSFYVDDLSCTSLSKFGFLFFAALSHAVFGVKGPMVSLNRFERKKNLPLAVEAFGWALQKMGKEEAKSRGLHLVVAGISHVEYKKQNCV